jgi:hypothetical protein
MYTDPRVSRNAEDMPMAPFVRHAPSPGQAKVSKNASVIASNREKGLGKSSWTRVLMSTSTKSRCVGRQIRRRTYSSVEGAIFETVFSSDKENFENVGFLL